MPYWQCLGEGMLEGAGSSKMGSSRPLLLLQSAVEELSPVLGKRTPRAPPHSTIQCTALLERQEVTQESRKTQARGKRRTLAGQERAVTLFVAR